MRIGFGYDVHRLKPGLKLVLGGVEISYDKGLEGHSDADVLVHAIIDALLGAAAAGDIGSHFPDNDESYKGISSLILLSRVKDKLWKEGYKIINIDSTVVAQTPRLSGYIDSMKSKIAETLEIACSSVSVKATTTEGLGFTGSGEGIAAYSVVLIGK